MSATKKQKLDDDTTKNSMIPIKAGFLGCGTIASAIATSLATPSHASNLSSAGFVTSSISVTKRSESKSSKLKETFPELVTVYDSAMDVVKHSNIVFLCVLPQQAEEMLGELKKGGVWNGEEHTLISLVSTSKVEELIQLTGLPSHNVYKMICLPSIAKREGCALLQPASTNGGGAITNNGNAIMDVKSLLDALGGCVICKDDESMNTLMVTTAMMGPLYGVMRNNREWLVKRGISPQDASYFVGRSYLSMVQDAERQCEQPQRFDDLIEEQTPGGLNEQALGNLDKQNVFDSYDKAMDAVLSRLQGKSDGSLPSSSSGAG
eukprot:CAMPEP_0183728140 /NCGR_PEP_ID=MMETSP0737-20130205/27178_1 /TAXON_ID=385413 /ORGANISM="Thalassiosira miniscula, Strain CCMP1093" /LENGTH=320 /DNA_ID=CAMNT_0025959981 /DNA_START=176 /DNA_END=1138 /DNA_ORIENTATION=+